MNRDVYEEKAVACLNALYRYAVSLTHSYDFADDLVQETFKRSLAAWRQIPAPEAVRPVLFRILHNYYVDEWRKKRRRPLMAVYDEDSEIASPPLSDDDAERVREALSDEVISALGELSSVLREAIWLREIEDFSYEEISAIVDVPVGTVRSRLARARRQMASSLQSYARQRGVVGRTRGPRESGAT